MREQDVNRRDAAAQPRAQLRKQGYRIFSFKPNEAIPQVYLYVMESSGFHKVGVSSNTKRRLQGVQAQCPLPVRLIASRGVRSDVAGDAEHIAHKTLWEFHHHTEWFTCDSKTAVKAISKAVDQVNMQPVIWDHFYDPPEIWAHTGPNGCYLRRVPVHDLGRRLSDEDRILAQAQIAELEAKIRAHVDRP